MKLLLTILVSLGLLTTSILAQDTEQQEESEAHRSFTQLPIPSLCTVFVDEKVSTRDFLRTEAKELPIFESAERTKENSVMLDTHQAFLLVNPLEGNFTFVTRFVRHNKQLKITRIRECWMALGQYNHGLTKSRIDLIDDLLTDSPFMFEIEEETEEQEN